MPTKPCPKLCPALPPGIALIRWRQVCRDPLDELASTFDSSLRLSLKDAHGGALADLEAEFESARKLMKGGAGSVGPVGTRTASPSTAHMLCSPLGAVRRHQDLILAAVTTQLASVLENFASAAMAAVETSNEQVSRGHSRSVKALQDRAGVVINEVRWQVRQPGASRRRTSTDLPILCTGLEKLA